MGIEQSMNRDCGVLGGLTGIATNIEALHRWCLTSHLRASVTYAFKTNLCGLGEDDRNYTQSQRSNHQPDFKTRNTNGENSQYSYRENYLIPFK